MRRRSRPPRDSLDLLLDTMCNAFGGIVLIAILVALLIEKPGEGEKATPVTREELAALRKAAELERLEEEIRATEAVHEEKKLLIELTSRRDELKIALQNRQETETFSMVDLNRKLGTLLAEKNELLTKITALNTEVSSLEQALRQEEEKLTRLENEMKEVIASRTTETRPPELRDASGQQVNIILEHGRIYPIADLKIDESGQIYGFSQNDSSIRWEGDFAFPIAGQGLSVEADTSKLQQLFAGLSRYNRMQASLPSERVFVYFIVYPDSFEVLTPLRELVSSAGEIRDGWKPIEKGQPMGFSSEGKKGQID